MATMSVEEEYVVPGLAVNMCMLYRAEEGIRPDAGLREVCSAAE